MIVVAVDTATDRLSVAAGEPGGRVVSRWLTGSRRHTGQLVALVTAALDELGVPLQRIEALAMSDGPGSFTGLRVAAAWAKGLTRVRDLSLWTASTLLVRAVPHLATGQVVAAAGSAQRGELYLAGYRAGPGDSIVTVLRPTVLPSDGALPEGFQPTVVVGDLDSAALGRWSWGPARLVAGPAGAPNASALIELVGRAGGAREIADPTEWEPEYGRLAEAQVKWEQAHGRPLVDSSFDGR